MDAEEEDVVDLGFTGFRASVNLLLHFLRNTPNDSKSGGPSYSVKVRINSVLQVSENFDTQDEATYLEKGNKSVGK